MPMKSTNKSTKPTTGSGGRARVARWMTAAAVFAALASPTMAAEEREYGRRTLRESVRPPAERCRLVVDNVWGDVRVVGIAGAGAVEIEAAETVWAASAAAAERAAREVRLDVAAREGAVEVIVDGPFRDRRDRRRWADHHRHPGYTVAYDIAVRAPRQCDLDVRTVNDGEVEVADLTGALGVYNVNGGIRLDRVTASGGEIATVNGPIDGSLLASPSRRLSFRSVNGRIDVSFPPRLAADLRLESAWGEMWSELDLAPLPAAPPTRRDRDGRLVIEVGRGASLRAGAGGAEIHFETLNGDILIRKGGVGR